MRDHYEKFSVWTGGNKCTFPQELQEIWAAISKLDQWIDSNGWAGYDPYDIKGTPLFLYLAKLTPTAPFPLKVIRTILTRLEKWQPLMMRRLFRIKRQINPKALGLLATGYLNLYAISHDPRFKSKALKCLDWLQNNPSIGYTGLCWGYPFNWQSKVFIPRWTPSAVVSSIVGHAFWTAYQIFNKDKYLDRCKEICDFFINDLNVDKIGEECICFSYTPIDNFHVHNANLFVAEYLIRIGTELKRNDFLRFGRQAANYALREQNPDGSLFYWGSVQNHFAPEHIDHYHSGFEIRMLWRIGQITGDKQFIVAAERYYRYYLKKLMRRKNGHLIPKFNPKQFYPINIHACAEAVLCSSALAAEIVEARKLLPYLIQWVIKKMQTPRGWFRYLIFNTPLGEYSVDIPYIRWGQAWMLVALSSFLKSITDNTTRDSTNENRHDL